jgi:hypothetical protein
MTSQKESPISSDPSPELVPVVEPGALALPQPTGPGNELALGDLLSDALFGEVIDISDLIPRMLSPSAETGELGPLTDTTGTGFGGQGAGDDAGASGQASMLTILYDDNILAWDSPIL